MSFSIRLANDEATVEPGSSVPVAFEIVNAGSKEEEFEISIEGLDPEWAAIPVPTLWVQSGETKVERIFIKPPRESESKAGIYPFVIRVRNLDTGESKTVQSSLAVNSFSHVSIEANPKRGTVTSMSRETAFEVSVINLGNTEENLQLFASDVDDLIAFEFEQNQITLGPGQQRLIPMAGTATKVKALQSMAIAPVTISTRSTDNPAVAANCQVHVEVRPIVSPGPLIAVLAILVVLVGWILSIPKPPEIVSYSVQPRSITVGDPVTLVWDSSHANSVTITAGGALNERLPADGELTFSPEAAGDYTIEFVAVSGKVRSKPIVVTVTVEEPPVMPEAKILAFAANQKEIPLGSLVVFNYRLNDAAVYAYLEPIGQIDPKATSIQVPSPPDDLPGKGVKTMEYTLIVRNSAGQEVKEKITVKFVKDSKAQIGRFSGDPLKVDPLIGRTTIRWQVTGAARLTLTYGDRTDELTTMDDRRDFIVSEDTVFTLTAVDDQGLETKKTITVKVNKEEEPNPPTVDPDGGDTGEPTGSTTGTTGTSTGGTAGGTSRPGGNR